MKLSQLQDQHKELISKLEEALNDQQIRQEKESFAMASDKQQDGDYNYSLDEFEKVNDDHYLSPSHHLDTNS
jgi:hypothetical protein